MQTKTKETLNIVVAGYIVGGPLGGLVWHHLQYVLGLHQMGHNVLFVEDSDSYPSCYNPQTHLFSDDPSYGLRFINEVFAQYGLQHRWAYYHQHTNTWFGAGREKVVAFAQKANLFLNLFGAHPVREMFADIPVRVFVDTDPVFTQIRHLTEPAALSRARQHTHFFTYGENFGKPACSMPNDGLPWKPTRQPVVLAAWQPTPGNKNGKWTTVMQWDSYKPRQHNGRLYGMKSASFEPYFSLPKMVAGSFELAVGSATAPKEKLSAGGWNTADPLAITARPATYQQYMQQSKGEWSVAKQGYVASFCGWFSERSAGYLACGRPVVTQETGFSELLPAGKGLFAFSSLQEAVAAIEEADRDYAKHCKAARALAAEYFRHDKVLASLLQACSIGLPF